jgi:very-short-patch-repair endonuclease
VTEIIPASKSASVARRSRHASTTGEADLGGAVKLSRSKAIAQKFADQCAQRELPDHERELRFAQGIGRQWRFDFAFPLHRLAVEIEGLVVMRVNGELLVKGRHASISGFKEDCEKYAWAVILGWRVLRFEQSQVRDKTAIDMTARALAALEGSVSVASRELIAKRKPKKPEKFSTAPLF